MLRAEVHVRVSLFVNEDAGDGTSLHEIREALERRHHELVHVVTEKADAPQIVERDTDLVVAAGGDGTVSAVARALAKTSIPFAILPLGTANNIAKSLGIHSSIESLIARWETTTPRPLDLGMACGTWGERRFIEAVGCGLVPASIATAKAQPADEGRPSSTAQLPTATLTYLDVLERLEPRRCTISVDGTQIGGEFLLVEVLNMPCVGPNLILSDEADPSDGFFTVVTATESDRDDLADYLEHRLDGQHRPLSLETRRARRVEIRGWDVTHVDAKLLYAPDGVSVQIEPAALRVLA